MDITRIGLAIDSTDVRQATGELNRMQKAGQSVESTVGKIGKRLLAMGAAYVSVRALGHELSNMVTAASALEETMNKYSVVFRGLIGDADRWAANLADNYNMSERAAKSYMSSVQDMLVPMGLARDEAGKLSNEIVKLSADIGSFNDMPTAEVMANIRSALVGEYEPMRKYGVVLTATTVQQKALNMGLAKTVDELTAANKAQAAYKMMVEGSADAIGDVARSQGTYAYETRRLEANLEDLRSKIGGAMLPTLSSALESTNAWIDANEELIAQNLPEFINGVAVAGTWVIDSFQGVGRAFELSGKTISVIALGIEREMLELADTIVNGPIRSLNGVIDLYNAIPALPDIDPLGLSGLGEDIQAELKIIDGAIAEGVKDINEVLERDFLGRSIREGMKQTESVAESTGKSIRSVGKAIDTTASSAKDFSDEAQKIIEQTRTPLERLRMEGTRLVTLLDAGLIDRTTFDRGIAQIEEAYAATVEISEDAAEEVTDSWERAIENIQDIWAEGIGDGLKGELRDLGDYGDMIFSSLADSSANMFASIGQEWAKNLLDPGSWMFSNGMPGLNMTNGQAGLGIAGSLAGAAQSGNQGSIIGSAAGAALALIPGVGLPVAALASAGGGMLGGLFGGDDEEERRIDMLIATIERNIVAIERNTASMRAELDATTPYGADIAQADIDLMSFLKSQAIENDKLLPILNLTVGNNRLNTPVDSVFNNTSIGEFYKQFTSPGDFPEGNYKNYSDSSSTWASYLQEHGVDEVPATVRLLLAEFERYFTQLESIASDAIDSFGGTIDSWQGKLGLGATEFERMNQEFSNAFGDENSGILGDITSLLSLADQGAINLDDAQIAKLEAFRDSIGEIGEAIPEYFRNQRGDVRQQMRDLINPLTPLEQQIKAFADQFEALKDEFVDAGGNVSDLTGLTAQYNARLAEMRAEYNRSLIYGASDLAYGITGNKDILADKLDMLSQDLLAADTAEDQLAILQDQYSVLQQIYAVNTQSLQEQINSVRSIDSAIADLQGQIIAPQSMEFFEGRYSSLLSAAQSGDAQDIQALLGFVSKYRDFADAYGTDMNDLTSGMIGDLQDLRDNISGGATLSDLQSQLEAINENTIEMPGLSTSLDDITQGLRDIIIEAGGTPSFRGGGTISGPLSGYTTPVTFHGTEHIIPESKMEAIVSRAVEKAVSVSGDGKVVHVTIEVPVNMDGREFDRLVAEWWSRSGSEIDRTAQKQTAKYMRKSA